MQPMTPKRKVPRSMESPYVNSRISLGRVAELISLVSVALLGGLIFMVPLHFFDFKWSGRKNQVPPDTPSDTVLSGSLVFSSK